MIPYLILTTICFIVSLVVGQWVMLIPSIGVLLLAIFLRIHVARRYEIIRSNDVGGVILECMTGLFCYPCSIAQSKPLFVCRIIVFRLYFVRPSVHSSCYSL
jgi:hypothetical protein